MSGYLQLSFEAPRQQAGPAADLLDESGALSVTVRSANDEDCFDLAAPGDPPWEQQILSAIYPGETRLDTVLVAISRLLGPGREPTVTRLPDEDWERSWLERFSPEQVGDNLWVCPSWCEPVEPDAVNLVIDPGLAFGTGTHETTRLCLEYLSRLTLDNDSVLDYGCGSGILAIAALKLGAGEAVGIDVDEKAVETSRRNAELNDVAPRYRAELDDGLGKRQFDLLFANILAGTLEELAPRLMELLRPGGKLVLSGILDSQRERVLSAYDRLLDIEVHERGQWLMVAGTRP